MMTLLKKYAHDSSGISLYFTALVLSIIFVIGIAIIGLLLNEVRIARDIGRFVPAVYAADSGIERALYKVRKDPANPFATGICVGLTDCTIGSSATPELLDNSATYYVVVLDSGAEWCSSITKCVLSIGTQEDTARGLIASF
jgi:hypothetical protein